VRSLDPAVARAIALPTGVVETYGEGAEELEVFQALNVLLGQRLSTRVRNAMVRYEQLTEWQKKRPSRLPEPYTADSVPNAQKLNKKVAILDCV
jgi:hypothetical protein